MPEWLVRLLDWLRRERLDRELSEELRFHRERLEQDAVSVGSDPGEARALASRRLGSVVQAQEAARDRWSWPWLDHFLKDTRYALRGLRRSPGFTATVVITLGLGIGANAAMFGVIDRLMFRPYPYLRDPGRVHRVYLQTTGRERTNTTVSFPYRRYLDLRQWTTSFSEHAAVLSARHGVGIGEQARVQPVVGVSASFWQFFDIRPALGRFFGPAEDGVPAGANVVVLGYGYWKSELGGRAVLGEALQIGSTPYTIIGVAPPGFVGIAQTRDPAVFVPVTAYAANEGGGSRSDYWLTYRWDWIEMMVRRKPGVSLERATADLTGAFIRSRVAARAVHPELVQVERANPHAIPAALRTAAGPDPGLESRTLLWVTGVAVIVLLIACANVANLYLARTIRRRREVALRLALGVTRGRLAAQSLTESLVLSLLGCAAGVLVGQWAGGALRGIFLPYISSFDLVDWRTLGVAMAAALLAAVVTGLAPVLLAEQRDVAATLKSGGRQASPHRSRLRSALLVAQGALSVVLLVGAGLFVRSLNRVGDLHVGFDPGPVVIMYWESRGSTMSEGERAAVRQRVLETAQGIPEVARAAWVSSMPMQGTSTLGTGLAVPGIDSAPRLGRFNFQTTTADYFDVLGTRILRGRAFTEADRAGAPPVVVVSESMARVLWPRQEAVGQCVRINPWGPRADTMPCTTVIGIAEDALQNPQTDQPLRYYLPDAQVPIGPSQLLLRVRGDPAVQAEGVRRAIQRALPGLSFLFVQQMRDLFQQQRKAWRMGATMFVAFGVLALVVAAIGLYGVIGYDVAQRMHELGVRIALGAQSRNVVGLVVRQAITFALAGAAIGLGLALVLSRWIQPLLFRQPARDPLIYGLVGAALLAVAVGASALPAFRATRADPNTALRSD